MRFVNPLLLSLLALSSCNGKVPDSIARGEFGEVFAPLSCDRQKECSLGGYQADHDDHKDCLENMAADWEDVAEEYESFGCEYDAAGGAALYEVLLDSTCGELYNAAVEDAYDEAFCCAGCD
ncbi:MAG: hypothetical protein HN348_21240 [Proteobacteria bacterium]|jgi:hypothetical protein|nr:hypothetical protein [Pseudomonadota bacterium]